MNPRYPIAQSLSRWPRGLSLVVGLLALLVALPLICAERGAAPRAPAPRAPAPARSVTVERSTHGSVRHSETQVIQHPVEVRHEPERPVEVHHEVAPPREVVVHHDVDIDVHRRHFWDGFAFGRRWAALPLGFITLQLGGAPYYYCGGIYYQPVDGGYQEVYPPVGAVVPQLPDGAIAINAGGLTYFYAGGAFYLQQPDGTFAIAPTPLGVVVPELPPGAIQVSVNGTIAYQFNGIYYEPVFVNGVTQYETFNP